jgi:hypothetical protein
MQQNGYFEKSLKKSSSLFLSENDNELNQKKQRVDQNETKTRVERIKELTTQKNNRQNEK